MNTKRTAYTVSTTAITVSTFIFPAFSLAAAPHESAIFLPSGVHDLRLHKNSYFAKGTSRYEEGLKSDYYNEVFRYARKLFQQKQYKQALKAINLALVEKPDVTLNQAEDLHLQICQKLAETAPQRDKDKYYQLILKDCEEGFRHSRPIDYYLPKVDALAGLNRRSEAISCCQEGYNYALGSSADTEPFASRLRSLGVADKLPAETTEKTIAAIKQDIFEFLKYDVCPTQKEIEQKLGTSFIVSQPEDFHFSSRKIDKTALYNYIQLRIPHKPDDSTSLTFNMKPEKGAISEEMVRQWFGSKVPRREPSKYTVGLVYEYPWGEFSIAFSPFHAKSAYEWTYRWSKSSEADGLKDPHEGPQPTFQEKLKAVDDDLEKRDFKWALQDLYWRVCGPTTIEEIGHFPSKEKRDAVRSRLIRWKELENKPEVVEYIRQASFTELSETMRQIITGERTDFFTLHEAKNYHYHLLGEMDADYKGNCTVYGFHGIQLVKIIRKTEASQQFFDHFKIRLPVKRFYGNELKVSPLPGALIDRIAEEQDPFLPTFSIEQSESPKPKQQSESYRAP